MNIERMKRSFCMPRTIQGKYVTKASQTFQAGDVSWQKGNYDEARQNYEKAASLYHEDNDAEGEAFVLTRLGELEISLDDFNRAEKSLKAACKLVKNLPDGQNTYADALIKLSKMETARGETEQALKIIRDALIAASQINSRDLQGDAYDHEAYIYLLRGQEKDALQAYAKAAEMFRKDGTSLKEASVLRAMARIEMKNRNYDTAHDILERCRDLYRENGDLLGEASALSAIGSLRYVIRDIANARKALMKSVYLYGKVAHHFAEAEALLYLARVEAYNKEQGDFELAKAHYKRSIELFDFLQNETMKKAVLEEYHNFLNRTACDK